MHKVLRRLFLEPLIGQHALARVDRQHNRQRRRRLLLEDSDLLRLTVFRNLKVIPAQPTHRRTLRIGHIQRDVDQPRLYLDRRNVPLKTRRSLGTICRWRSPHNRSLRQRNPHPQRQRRKVNPPPPPPAPVLSAKKPGTPLRWASCEARPFSSPGPGTSPDSATVPPPADCAPLPETLGKPI